MGSRPASNANKPIGKKQIETIICHAGIPPLVVISPHLGQFTCAIILPPQIITILTIHTITKANIRKLLDFLEI